jgi:basic membrane protein A
MNDLSIRRREKMKAFKWLSFMLVAGLLISACGGATPTEEAPVVSEGPFRVAVVMPSAINDLAFSQSMYDALFAIQDMMGGEEAMELVYSESRSATMPPRGSIW